MTQKEQFQYAKGLAIAKAALNTAEGMAKSALTVFPKKRIFHKRNRKLVRQRHLNKRQALARLYMMGASGVMQLAVIMVQPMPRYDRTLQSGEPYEITMEFTEKFKNEYSLQIGDQVTSE